MQRVNKSLVGLTSATALIALLVITGLGQRIYTKVAVDYPESWREIKPGMVSRDARMLLGEPQTDGRGLKSLDRWQYTKRGVEVHLDLWFDVESHEDAVVTKVVMWQHFLGVDTAKHVEPPQE